MTLTFDPLTLKVCGRSGVTCMWSQSVANLVKIEHSPAELLITWQICAPITSRCDLDLWPRDLRTSVVDRLSRDETLYQTWAKLEIRGWVIDHLVNFRIDNRAKILHFSPPPLQNSGEVWAECLSEVIRFNLGPNLLYTFAGSPLRKFGQCLSNG